MDIKKAEAVLDLIGTWIRELRFGKGSPFVAVKPDLFPMFIQDIFKLYTEKGGKEITAPAPLDVTDPNTEDTTGPTTPATDDTTTGTKPAADPLLSDMALYSIIGGVVFAVVVVLVVVFLCLGQSEEDFGPDFVEGP